MFPVGAYQGRNGSGSRPQCEDSPVEWNCLGRIIRGHSRLCCPKKLDKVQGVAKPEAPPPRDVKPRWHHGKRRIGGGGGSGGGAGWGLMRNMPDEAAAMRIHPLWPSRLLCRLCHCGKSGLVS